MTFASTYRNDRVRLSSKRRRLSISSTSLAIYVLILFPVLPLSAGQNGFLVQAIFAIIIVLPALVRRELPPPLPRYWLILTSYYAVIALAMAFRRSSNEIQDYATLLRFIMPLAALVAGYSIAKMPANFLRKLIVFVSLSLLLIHALVLMGEYSVANIWYFRDSSELGQSRAFYHIFRAAGFFGYPSEASITLSILLLLYVGRVGQWNMSTLSIVTLVFLAVLASQSRAGLGLLSIALFCLLVYLPGRRKLFFAFLAAIVILSNLSLTYLESTVAREVSQTNLVTRFHEVEFLSRAILEDRAVRYGVVEYRQYFGTLESNYLTLYLRGGLVALLAEFITMIVVALSIYLTPINFPGGRAIRLFAAMLFFANAVAINFVSGIAIQGKAAVFVWVLWGFIAYLGRQAMFMKKAPG